MKTYNFLLQLIETLAGALFFVVGLINLCWGNDQFFGVFIILLSLLFFAPTRNKVKKLTGIWVAGWLRILISLFIFWSSLGVGELGDKIDMMISYFNSIK